MYRHDVCSVRAGVYESAESYFTGNQAIVARLRHLRQELEEGMAPDPWTDLEVPVHTILSDVCDILRLSASEKSKVLGLAGQQRQDAFLDESIEPRPLNERQIQALYLAQRRRRITNGDLQRVFPHLSAEAIRLDLADLVRRGLLRRHGRCRGTVYTLA
jgi:hypothetical protein